MSAFGGKADVNHCVGECPLLAISGHTATKVRSPNSSEIGCTKNPLWARGLGSRVYTRQRRTRRLYRKGFFSVQAITGTWAIRSAACRPQCRSFGGADHHAAIDSCAAVSRKPLSTVSRTSLIVCGRNTTYAGRENSGALGIRYSLRDSRWGRTTRVGK